MKSVILITGYARAGKDTLAEGVMLGAHRLVCHINFADPLKNACDNYMQILQIGGSGSTTTFRNENFKVKNRDFLISAGSFARSLNPDVFALAFCRECEKVARQHDEPNLSIVCSDWRYLNELDVVKLNLERKGWKVYTVSIHTAGVDAASVEEGTSIGEIFRNVPVHLFYTFKPDAKQDILNEGKSLSGQLGL